MKLTGGHIEIMLILEMEKKELTGGRIEIYCINIDYKNGIGFMIIIEMEKKELTGGHIGFSVFI